MTQTHPTKHAPNKSDLARIRTFRIVITLSALVLGAGLVALIAFTGSRARGPIEDLVVLSSKVAKKAEETITSGRREQGRTQRLAWFQPVAQSKAALLKPTRMMLGAYDNEGFSNVAALEDTLRTTLPLVHIYAAWGDKPTETFPEMDVRQIRAIGSSPVITWEPWLADFDPELHPNVKPKDKRDPHGMKDVARGTYDFYIKAWAQAAAADGKPIFLRFGHEMNDPYRYPWGPQNNTAKEFIAAWRHVHAVFKKAGAKNVIWVWSPHPAYGWFNAYYPGRDVVDYVGIGALNYGTVAKWSEWWSFDDIFGKYYPELATFKKPMIITEFGTLAVGGNRAEWYKKALTNLPTRFPAVHGLIFFHVSADNTTTQQTLNWYIKDDPEVIAVIRQALPKL